MRVTHRLYLAALPSLVGALAVAALAYWGQYSRVVPGAILLIAVVATAATLLLSWVNVRYVAKRVERLARGGRTPQPVGTGDELDTIEGDVAMLRAAVEAAEIGRTREVAREQRHRLELGRLLASVAGNASLRLDEVRLPLHILLENHFGELNENQEEMLGAARTSVQVVADEVSAIAELARLELGELLLRKDRVFPADALNAIFPVIRAQANAKQVQVDLDIEPLIPALYADASRLQQALQRLLGDAIQTMSANTQSMLSLRSHADGVLVLLAPVAEPPTSTQHVLHQRILEAMGGTVRYDDDGLRIQLST